ncbi:MAG: flagellar hook protein FlgE, partial [Rubrivivax sp.]|nr:flagellar hook protein FlgE [Rubrivivax sp.]
GLSGLNASSKNLEIIGNNIANANTYGTKVSRAEFSDVYAAALNGAGSNAVGIGTRLAAVAQQFTQGSITTTDNPMDLAVNGAGFFQVTDGKNPTMYTRNGQFKVDADGYIVNNAKQQLMGYAADGTGVIQPGQAVPLQLRTAGIAPKATDEVTLELNLHAKGAVTSANGFDPTNASTYNNATSLATYDSQGIAVPVTFYFQKAGDNSWNVYATADGAVTNGGAPLVSPMTFLPDGSLDSANSSPSGLTALTLTIDAVASSANNAGHGAISSALDLGSLTQFGSAFAVTNVDQSGYAAGQLSSLAIESDGVITARYSNGQSRPAGQIEIANFRNPQGLQPMGDNAWARTSASGDPVTGVPGDGNLGSLQSGALEESNIDLTGELVSMITAQRIYQANAQTIKTQDQVLQTLVNLR